MHQPSLAKLILFGSLSFCCYAPVASYGGGQAKVQQLLQTTQSWDGVKYSVYPTGQPEITLLKIYIPAHTALDWHRHPMISVGYILSGKLILQKKATGERKTVYAGQALAETVETVHRGYTTNEPVELIVFYAGRPGMPVSIKER